MKIMIALLLAFAPYQFWDSGLKNACPIALDEKPAVRINDHVQGIWQMAEDTDSHNYFIIEKDGDYQYSITYMNRGGSNRGLEHGRLILSEVGQTKYLVLRNWDAEYPGYIYLKVKVLDERAWDMTVARIAAPEMARVKTREELVKLLEKNMNNPSFYGKDLHFRKKFEFNSFR